MARDGSGTYNLPAGQPVVTNTVISSTTHNTLASDMATALTGSVAKDGQTVMTGNLDMDGNGIILDGDGDTRVIASTDDVIDVRLGGVDQIKFGWAKTNNNGFVNIDPAAVTADATENTHRLAIHNTNAITIPTGTTPLVSSVYLTEPNITATGTVTDAATLAIAGAPTEGSNNYSLLVQSGNVRFEGDLTVVGTVNASLNNAVEDAVTNAVTNVADFEHTTTGTPANGIGTGITFTTETSASNNEIGSIIESVATDVTATSEDFDLVFKNMAAGSAAAEKARITSTGALVLAGGSITDSSGAISFGDENLTTTGTLAAGATTITGAITSTGTGPSLVLDDTSTSTLQHQFRSGSNNLLIEADINDVEASTEIRLAIDGTEVVIFAASQNQIAQSTIIGSTSVTPDGTLHVHTASAGSVTANTGANTAVFESDGVNAGISILGLDTSNQNIYFGSPSDNAGARIRWNLNDDLMSVGTLNAGAELRLLSGDGVTNLTLSGASGSELATFAGDVAISGSSCDLTNASNPEFKATDTTNTVSAILRAADTAGSVGTSTAHTFTIKTANTDAITIDTSQNATFAGDVDIAGSMDAANMRINSTGLLLSHASNNTGVRYGGGDTGQVLLYGANTLSGTFGANGITLAPNVTAQSDLTLSEGKVSITDTANEIALNIDSSATNVSAILVDAPTADFVIDIQNSAGAAPNGLKIDFTAASPDDNSAQFLRCLDSTTNRCIIYSDGDIANHDGTYGTISDRFYKSDIQDARPYWEDWKRIQFRTFTKGEKKQFGVIADELEEVFPALVHTSPDEKHPDGKSQWVDTMNLNHIGGKVLQEALSKIEALEAELEKLKKTVH